MADGYAAYLFHQGANFHSYKYLGTHKIGANKYVFRVWAPGAENVFLIGSFNFWQQNIPMERISDNGVWETVTRAKTGDMYKFRIIRNGRAFDKADPYAFRCELPPGTASVVYDFGNYKWNDAAWISHRMNSMSNGGMFSRPINIYEVHLGSWKRGEENRFLNYREIAAELVPYVKQMGYTHVELLPVMEHPYEPSWGYQVCGYYAPTSRFGSPEDLCFLIESLHRAGVGVILDWVPAHFPKDAHGLYEFDGAPLYEYQGSDRMEHRGWGTRKFDVGRDEVESFLVSNAVFWAEVYHADGLRVDAVASMLYLDYDKLPGEWVPNVYGDNRCLEAMSFFKKLNGIMKKYYPDVMMIAEESSAWANVTGFDGDGLGFDFKWNMGWMNDALSYVARDPIWRKYHHNEMTFSLTYAFGENYILPISHDEVVHGKLSLIDKMSGEYEQKFATARVFAVYMMTHPGKKLNFMTNEFGQFREWDFDAEAEWFMLDYPIHAGYQAFWAELNHLYLNSPALHTNDGGWSGFEWLNADDAEHSVYSYNRIGLGGEEMTVVLNFTPVARQGYEIKGIKKGVYRTVLNTDLKKYGGSLEDFGEPTEAEMCEEGGYKLNIDLPALGAIILERNTITDKEYPSMKGRE